MEMHQLIIIFAGTRRRASKTDLAKFIAVATY
jgi:hypothetical protein